MSRLDDLAKSVGILADSIAALTIRFAALEGRVRALEPPPPERAKPWSVPDHLVSRVLERHPDLGPTRTGVSDLGYRPDLTFDPKK